MLLISGAWLGEVSGLATLLGALWGGVLLPRLAPLEHAVNRVLSPLSEVFLPLSFISVGMRVPVATQLDQQDCADSSGLGFQGHVWGLA